MVTAMVIIVAVAGLTVFAILKTQGDKLSNGQQALGWFLFSAAVLIDFLIVYVDKFTVSG